MLTKPYVQACFDWYHPECVSALRRMQIETLLSLQRWICRSCFIKNKKYKNAKQMLTGKSRKKNKNDKDDDDDNESLRRSSRSKNSFRKNSAYDKSVGEDTSSDDADREDNSSTRSKGIQKSASQLSALSSGPSLSTDLKKLLANIDGEGTPRFLRWAHKVSLIGHAS